ncbi:MAG TPA: helix-turn-helix domain-containing protein [Paenibacillus sp.]|nr:helix-turn-helix domain-containing protein [Paenibacillus sp.]
MYEVVLFDGNERFVVFAGRGDFDLAQVTEALHRLAARNEPERSPPLRSVVVEEMIRYVDDHLSDESLTLQKLAKEVFYMNSDYLGKLFKRQTGERFSHYVMRARIQRAARLIREFERLRMHDIAVQIGYGNNPHYFSQAFRKIFGCTPTEYRAGRRSERESL